jgi:hypothetical protein
LTVGFVSGGIPLHISQVDNDRLVGALTGIADPLQF